MTKVKKNQQAGLWGSHKPYVWTREHFLHVVLTGKKPLVRNHSLAQALKQIDRRDFLSPEFHSAAYSDTELTLHDGFVVPTPLTLVELIDQLDLKEGDRVLELGSGTGFTLALLDSCVGDRGMVYSVERSQFILEQARTNLAKYPDLKNYELLFKDGSDGLQGKAPFDAILVNFAVDQVPMTILEQLKIGGRLVLPLTDMNINLYVRESEEEVTAKLVSVKRFRKVQYGVE